MSRQLLVLFAHIFPAAVGLAQGTSSGQGLFSPATHLWVTANPGFEPIIRTYRLADLDGDGYAEYAIHGGTNESPPPGWVRIMDGRSGLVRQEWTGSPQQSAGCPWVTTGEKYGKYGAALDLNGDGLQQEVVLGAWYAIVVCTLPSQVGRAELRSFPQGVPLLSLAPLDSGNFGVPVEAVGDLNGDGAEEVLIGAPSWSGNTGKVRILSGIGLTEVYSYTGWHTGQLFGNRASGGGDVDGDGLLDFILGAPYTYYPPSAAYNAGTARVYSGSDGSLIREHASPWADYWRGQSVEILGDTNGDAHAEYVVVDAFTSANLLTANNGSAFRVYDGATGTVLYTINGLGGSWDVDRLEDVTGDGMPDLLIGSMGNETTPWSGSSWLSVASGIDGTIAFQTSMDGANPLYPAVLGDVNGDGREDIGAVRGNVFNGFIGQFRAYTWTNLLVSGVLYPGGSATFLVKTPSRPGRLFRLGLSTGAGGFMLGPFWIPVTPDALFFDTASALGGTLDAIGTGYVTIPIPPFPALSGLTLYATGAVLEPGQAFPVGVVLNRVTVQIQ